MREYRYSLLTDLDELSPLAEDEVEVVLAEARQSNDKCLTGDPECDDGFTCVTALISLRDRVSERRTIAALKGSLEYARVSRHVVSIDACVPFLLERIRALAADWIDVVLLLGAQERFARIRIQCLIDALRGSLGHELGFVLLAGDSDRDFQELSNTTGSVQGTAGDGASTAAAMFISLAALGARSLLCCCDHADLGLLYPVAGARSMLVEAIWMRQRRQLCFASEADESAVRNARDLCTVVPSRAAKPLADYVALVSALCDLRPGEETCFATLVGPDLVPSNRRHPDIAHVLILCQTGS